jgi:hypothetical protein
MTSNAELMEVLNDGHFFEVMDRLHVAASMVDEHIMQHPVCKVDKELGKEVELALTHLYNAYQIAGKLNFNRHEKQ